MIGELAALGAAVSWTISAMLYGKALQQTKPISANIVRLSCTSAVLLIILAVAAGFGALPTLRLDIAALAAISGIVGLGLGDTLYMVSLKLIGVARAVPITCTYPLFNLLWAVFFIGEKVTSSLVLGVIIIFLGIWLLSHEKKNSDSQGRNKFLFKGVAAALATAVLWSVSIAMMGIAVKETPSLNDALIINTIRTAAIAALLLALSPMIDKHRNFLKMKRRTVATLIIGGIVALGLGWFFLAYSFIGIPESQAVPISSTTPLFSTLVAVVLLREKVTARNVLGSIIVVIGIFLVFLLK
ncbi:MAG: DMT family transporter [Candidatus Bathyarchaeia archaeon]